MFGYHFRNALYMKRIRREIHPVVINYLDQLQCLEAHYSAILGVCKLECGLPIHSR